VKDCLTLQQIAECCGTCHVTVCEQTNEQLSISLVWKNEHDIVLETSATCERSCKALHDILINQGVEMELADRVCSRLDLS
jgi:hypothetical protein